MKVSLTSYADEITVAFLARCFAEKSSLNRIDTALLKPPAARYQMTRRRHSPVAISSRCQTLFSFDSSPAFQPVRILACITIPHRMRILTARIVTRTQPSPCRTSTSRYHNVMMSPTPSRNLSFTLPPTKYLSQIVSPASPVVNDE